MSNHPKFGLRETLGSVKYLSDRTPEMAFTGRAEGAFAELSKYRDGSIYVGYYSGDSEWDRHMKGDEIVMAIEGSTTIILRRPDGQERIELGPSELVVVPRGTWHRFENSVHLKVMTVTPQPTDHSLEEPGG